MQACVSRQPAVPHNIYVSHNHSDHAGDLPVMVAVESRRSKPRLFAHPRVMQRIREHRLHELLSTGALKGPARTLAV